jgi:hypothetical protein
VRLCKVIELESAGFRTWSGVSDEPVGVESADASSDSDAATLAFSR